MDSPRSTSMIKTAIGLWVMGLVMLGMMPSADAKQKVLTGKMYASADGYAPGDELRLALRVDIDPKWHINSNTPSIEFLIPAELECETPENVAVDRIVYPEGKNRRFAFADEPLSVYDGQVVIYAAGKVAKDAGLGKVQLTCSFSYQACDDRSCVAPDTLELPLQIKVLPSGTSVGPTNSELFSSFPEPAEEIEETASGDSGRDD